MARVTEGEGGSGTPDTGRAASTNGSHAAADTRPHPLTGSGRADLAAGHDDILDTLGPLGTPAAQAAVVVVHRDGSWSALGDTFSRYFGYPRDAPATIRMLSLVHRDDRAAVVAAFRSALDGVEPTGPLVVRVRTASGLWRDLATVVRNRLHDPAVEGIVFYGIETRRARQAENALRAVQAASAEESSHADLTEVLEALSVGILLVDGAGRVAITNQTLVEMFDLAGPPFRHAGSDARSMLRKMSSAVRLPEGVGDHLDHLLAEPWATLGADLVLTGGRVVEIDVVPLGHGRTGSASADDAGESGGGALLHAWDVTNRAEAQQGLKERNHALNALVAAKNQFVASVSHELRSPLTSVVTFSNLLAQPDWGVLDDEQRQFVEVIQRNADRLLRLIEDLLLFSRLEARTLQFVPSRVHLPDLVRAAVAERLPIAQAADITLKYEVEGESTVSCDELRVNQVIGNLIGNALKFTPVGGRVTVRCQPAADGWRLSVSDTGIGIPPDDLDRIFDAFHRAANVERHGHPGTGLGLVISKAIVERHGGLMDVTSELGKGTTVTVWLPQRRAADREGDR